MILTSNLAFGVLGVLRLLHLVRGVALAVVAWRFGWRRIHRARPYSGGFTSCAFSLH
ncbi:hypothetical protein APY04_1649 [Hyphomicrobium sulfonivorans]|uniref:Uncharacterized protein n=1 Tax=Hyphomicrobium sulfonivorans TaxID=121290 RepID=A0A109BI16_HYPSL|nr:hypothetical protein [Hyphomicrobium sulfonivorans]KWT69172.1 hypothetical protein APY04_1649 [Hyphomicrobium sulfonivorans]